jgi:hypothetical protein
MIVALRVRRGVPPVPHGKVASKGLFSFVLAKMMNWGGQQIFAHRIAKGQVRAL